MNKYKLSIWLLIVLFCAGCSSDDNSGDDDTGNFDSDDWLIPQSEVRDGGPGKDGIPALENPDMINPNEADYLDEDDLVIGFVHNGVVRAYSHKVLDWHEIANDNVGGKNIAITYCPLTGTAIGWDREVGGQVSTFGVSGLLYNTNLMPYDRATDSRWSQLELQCVNGELIGNEIKTYQLVETEWSTWKQMYPETVVTSTNTGHSRNYQRYPYGSYQSNDSFLFPISEEDERLHPKERVHGIIVNGNVKAYRFDHFSDQPIILDDFENASIVLVGSQSQNFINSFFIESINGETPVFTTPTSFTTDTGFSSNVVLADQFGNEYDVFGQAVSGPNQGLQLAPTQSFIGMWFSWAPFYGAPELYEP